MTTEEQRLSGRTAFVVVLVVCVIAYLTTFFYRGFNPGTVTHVSAWIALCSLSGLWAGLGTFPFRIPIATAVAIVTALVSNGFDGQTLLYFIFSLSMVFIVGGTAFVIRLLFGELRQIDAVNVDADALQFRVRDILIWTTAIAGVLAVGRWLFTNQNNPGMEVIFPVSGLIGTLVITSVVAIWAFLGTRLSAARITAFGMILAIATFFNHTLVSYSGFWLVTSPVSQIPVVAAIYCLRLQDYRFVKDGFE